MSQKDPLSDLRKLNLPFDLDEVAPECHECIREQLKKYKTFVYPDGRRSVGFEVDCTGIKKEVIPQQLQHKYTGEELFKIKSVLDPVFFAENMVIYPDGKNKTIKLRDYQALSLRCTSPRRVLRWSRRVGKCLSQDAKILTRKGRISAKKLYELKEKPEIISFDQESMQLMQTGLYEIEKNGIRPVFELKTRLGRTTKVTSNHPFLIINKDGLPEWKELDELSVGDSIAVPKTYEDVNFKEKYIGDQKSRLLGYLTGDGGTSHKTSVTFSNIDKEILDDISNIVNDYKCELKHIDRCDYRIIGKGELFGKRDRNEINRIVTDNNLRSLAKNKRVPKDMFIATKNDICNFIGAYWDCDGWASVDNKPNKGRKRPKTQIGVGTSSYELALDISHLLLRLGILADISYKEISYNSKKFDHWHVIVSGKENVIKFYNQIPLRAKKENIENVISILNNFVDDKNTQKGYKDLIPRSICNYIDKVRKEKNLSIKKMAFDSDTKNYIKFSKQYSPSKRKVSQWNDQTLNDSYLKYLCNANIVWDKIVSVRYIGDEETFSMSVPETDTIVADDIISHNTLSVCIDIIHKLITRKKIRIILAAPMVEQVENIFMRVRDFFLASPALRSSVLSVKKSPHEMKLKNGSILKGFAAGSVQRGGDGTVIRGQDADYVYLEEADYVAEEAIQGAIIPLLTTNPDTQLIAFSTPMGFTTTPFYKFCKESPDYKEFHFSYRVLPWAKEVEKQRHNMTEEKWNHEYEAIFTESSSGVYKPKYIDAALKEYSYSDSVRHPYWSYCMGVDWNEKHGAEIIVLGHDPHLKKFRVVDAIHVGGSAFTQLNSVAKVIETYRKWKPQYIYADAGNGCLYKDSQVLTNRGIKLISNIKEGDLVLTHTGLFKEVIKKIKTGTKRSIRIKPSHCLYTTFSENHRHLVYHSKNGFNDFRTQFVNNDQIKLEEKFTKDLDFDKDFFFIPKMKFLSNGPIVVDLVEELKHIKNLQYDEKYIWTEHGYRTDNNLSCIRLIEEFNTSRATIQRTRRKAKNNQKMAPAEIKLFNQLNSKYGDKWIDPPVKKINRFIDISDKDFQYVFGWYLSEGNAGTNCIEICQMPFHYQSEFQRVKDICSSMWETNIVTKENGLERIFIKSRLIVELFKKLGGSHHDNKKIDPRIMATNPIETIKGIIQGDGCEKKHRVELSMTSFSLVHQVRELLLSNGILSGLHHVKSRNGNKEQLMLYFNAIKNNVDKINSLLDTNLKPRKGIQRRKFIETNNGFLVKIKKDSNYFNCNEMYDLTIEDDCSFVVNGFVTHNSTNIELLFHQAKKSGPGSDLYAILDVLKKYDSGAKVEVFDPIINEKVRKAAKPFMVDASIRMFEQKRIDISDSDTILEKQLRNYIIEKYTETNIPKFGLLDSSVEDHRLDAFNLAIVAFQLEFTDLFKREYIAEAALANNPLKERKEDSDEDEQGRGNRDINESAKNRGTIPVTQGKLDRAIATEYRGMISKREIGWGTKRTPIKRNNTSRRAGRGRPTRSNF